MLTYLETGQSEVADFDFQIFVNQDIVTLDVSVYNAQCVHVLEDSCRGQRYFDSCSQVEVHLLFLHMQQVEQAALRHVLKHYDNIGYFGHDAQEELVQFQQFVKLRDPGAPAAWLAKVKAKQKGKQLRQQG
jgi:hypothetical protein